MSVFISWCGKDREVKNQVAQALRDVLGPDEQIWDSDDECRSIFAEECMNGVTACEVFVYIMSDDSMRPSSRATNEVNAARALNDLGKLDFVIYKITEQDHVLHPVGFLVNHISCVFAKEGPEKLARRVQSLLTERRAGKPARVQEKSRPVIEGTSLGRSANFVEHSRDDVFARLDEAFARSNVVFAVEFDGYGRKSALREYFALHESEYDERIFLPFFSGTIRDFFINGLPFINVNDRIFENLDEKQEILKKAEVLNLLDKRTVIVVPCVTVGRRDDQFICDVLASLKCRIVFVTRSIPARMQSAFPAVAIGRMDDETLLRLFFRCYRGASPDEQEMLREPLLRFFDRVDGHTGSIELTATELENEFGLYPEDVPAVLEKISQAGGEELPERIFGLISSLFDGQQFTASQQAVLYAAALLAVTPVDEKVFVGLLKDCGHYDAEAMRSLSECKWLDADREKRLISMPSFLAEVCLSRIPQIDGVLAAVIAYLDDQLITALMEAAPIRAYRVITRAMDVFRCMGLQGFPQLYELMMQSLDEQPDMDFSMLPEVEAQAQAEIAAQPDDPVRAALESMLLFPVSIVRTAIKLQEVKKHQASGELGDEYLLAVIKDLGDYAQTMREMMDRSAAPAVRYFLNRLTCAIDGEAAPSGHRVCNDLLSLVTMLSENPDDAAEYGAEEQFVLETLCESLINLYRGENYLQLRLCEARLTLAELFGGFNSKTACFRNHHRYFSALVKMGSCTEDLDETYAFLMELLPAVKDEAFQTEDAAEKSRYSIMYDYLVTLLGGGRIMEAEQVLRESWQCRAVDDEMVYDRISCTEKVVYAYLDRAETEHAALLIDDALAQGDRERLRLCADPECAAAAESKLAYLETLLEIMEHGGGSTFEDDSAANSSYYKTYAADPAEKRLTPRYEAVARAAMAFDFSALDDEALRTRRQELMNKAQTVPLMSLAPEAFALVSEAGSRILGYRHHYVQYLGAAAIADGKIAEILNGEGKTYTIILAAFLHSLYGRQVHIADTSPYLCRRNFEWMRGVLELLGCRVGVIMSASLPHANLRYLASCDILYTLADAEVFLFMKEEASTDPRICMRYDVLIADEADQMMIEQAERSYGRPDERRQIDQRPLLEKAYRVIQLAQEEPGRYYDAEPRAVRLREEIYDLISLVFDQSAAEMDHTTLSTVERMIRTGITALERHEKGRDYFIHKGRLVAEDKNTGLFTGINSEYAFFYAIKEQDEGLYTASDMVTKRWINEINLYETIRQFDIICGTTATAASMRSEFRSFYGMEVYRVPPNREIRRVDAIGQVYFRKDAKYRAILEMVMSRHREKQPVLLVTENVTESRLLYGLLTRYGLPATLINAENAQEEAKLMSEAGKLGRITVATAIVNRGVDVCLGGNPTEMARQHLIDAGADPVCVQQAISALPHESTELIRRRYWDLVAIYQKQTEQERRQVEALGGLCVIGTTCFADMRVEQQMRGRAGRQGSPGESHTFYSMEDEPLQLFVNMSANTLLKLFADMEEGMQAVSLDRVIQKARLRLQSRTYADIDRTKYTRYLRPARQLFFRRIRSVTNADSLRAFLVEQLMQDPRQVQDLQDARAGKPLRADSLTMALGEKAPRLGRLATRKKAAELLADAFITTCAPLLPQGHARLCEMLCGWMLMGCAAKWPDYLSAMQRELDVKDQKYDQEKKREQHLQQYSKETSTRLYLEALESCMMTCIRAAEWEACRRNTAQSGTN